MKRIKKSNPYIVLAVLTLCFISFSVETDIYVPAFPQMMDYFDVSENLVQSTLSINFLGVFIGSLLFGPLSDAYGRRKILLSGLGGFAMSSLTCVFADSFEGLVVSRFVQGVSAGSILAVSSTAIFDRYDAAQSAKLLALLNSVVTVFIGLAPVIGSAVSDSYGWRGTFFVIFVLAVASFLCTSLFLSESLPPSSRSKLSIRKVIREYTGLLVNRQYVLKTLIWTLMFSTIMIYTANISIVSVNYLDIPLQSFGFYQSVTIGAFCVFSLLTAMLIDRLGMESIKWSGVISFFLGTVSLLLVSIYVPKSIVAISSAMALIGAGCALSMAIFFTESVTNISNSGAAIALAQSLRLLVSFALVDLSRIFFDGSIFSVAIVIFIVALFLLLVVYFDSCDRTGNKEMVANGNGLTS